MARLPDFCGDPRVLLHDVREAKVKACMRKSWRQRKSIIESDIKQGSPHQLGCSSCQTCFGELK